MLHNNAVLTPKKHLAGCFARTKSGLRYSLIFSHVFTVQRGGFIAVLMLVVFVVFAVVLVAVVVAGGSLLNLAQLGSTWLNLAELFRRRSCPPLLPRV